MTKFKKVKDDCWVHDDIAFHVFSKKPPEWIGKDIVMIYKFAYDLGRRHAQSEIKNALGFLHD